MVIFLGGLSQCCSFNYSTCTGSSEFPDPCNVRGRRVEGEMVDNGRTVDSRSHVFGFCRGLVLVIRR